MQIFHRNNKRTCSTGRSFSCQHQISTPSLWDVPVFQRIKLPDLCFSIRTVQNTRPQLTLKKIFEEVYHVDFLSYFFGFHVFVCFKDCYGIHSYPNCIPDYHMWILGTAVYLLGILIQNLLTFGLSAKTLFLQNLKIKTSFNYIHHMQEIYLMFQDTSKYNITFTDIKLEHLKLPLDSSSFSVVSQFLKSFYTMSFR